MARKLPEWIGKTDDSPVPSRVKDRIHKRAGERCQNCTTSLAGGKLAEYDHIIAIVNDGENRESNLQVLCVNCHQPKTKVDLAIKAKTARVRGKFLGIRKTRNPMAGSKASKWKKRMDGTVEKRI